ncbi:putative chaperonin [Escherichia coli]|uniref:Putative chaperonin n=1 Tax=Escherichia coli TaxID=562 RepID=A0A3S4LLQ2_ECOLX|nr:putative chaperonin [Escherichia coli]
MKDEILGLPEEEKRDLAALQDTARERQKQKFLEGFFIDVASIPGVGPARKAALRSFGIETAADVTRRSVKQVKGFGDHLTQAVIDWKASCERRFVFRPERSGNACRQTSGNGKNGRQTTSAGIGADCRCDRVAAIPPSCSSTDHAVDGTVTSGGRKTGSGAG